MSVSNIKKIAFREFQNAFRSRAALILAAILGAALMTAAFIGWQNFSTLAAQREKYQRIVEQKWVEQPDRHPHRVAHYGYLVFRPKSELGFFDFGIDSYAGVSVFLEAHRQNTVNFSEASFSGVMLRFGELSPAMALQLLVPLLIFFLGFAAVTAERENGTLPILLCQGASGRQILFGKALGIIAVIFALLAPIAGLTILLRTFSSGSQITPDSLLRIAGLLAVYAFYFIVCAFAAVLVSALSKSSRAALTTLVLIWILFCVVMPKATQTIGARLFPAPSKAQFEAALKADAARAGDSHNPDDPHFTKLRQETLKKYGVSDVKELPFNYSGLVMTEGEKLTSQIFREHYTGLIDIFRRQNSVTEFAAFVNPYLAVRSLSMALANSDFAHYEDFQRQTEQYRYDLAQKMNELHTHEIKFADDRAQKVSRENWKNQPPFVYRPKTTAWALAQQKTAVFSIFFWLGIGFAAVFAVSGKLSAI